MNPADMSPTDLLKHIRNAYGVRDQNTMIRLMMERGLKEKEVFSAVKTAVKSGYLR